MRYNLTDQVDFEINKKLKGINKNEQLQTYIHPDINFKRNSINLLVGRRGSGKTFNVIREAIKVSKLPDKGGYTSFVLISDKPNDSTVNEMLDLIDLKVIQTSYANAVPVLNEITEGKTAYDQVVRNNLTHRLTDESHNDILERALDDNFYEDIPHSIIVLDDALNVLKKTKLNPLHELLFRNRQPRFTIFICVQDTFGVPTDLRRNLDSFWLFGGLRDKMTFSRIITQFYPDGISIKENIWNKYIQLSNRDIIIFDYNPDGTHVKIIKN
jgi:Cdc6-like AAA superfamily ATPase